MKITRIVEQVKHKDRYSIFVDGVYAFSLGEASLMSSRLAPGTELTDAELKGWKRQSEEDKMYRNALRYAAMRQRSAGEMERYLRRKAVPPALAGTILNKLTTIGLLDDAAFARAFIAGRRQLRPVSTRKLQQLLRAKFISEELIGQALEGEDGGEQAALRALIAKKRDLPKYKADKLKLMQYLARQGFQYDDIKTALN